MLTENAGDWLTTNMHRTVTTWQEFREAWDGLTNFLMEGECVPFAFDMPSIERVVDEVRRDPEARISSGRRDVTLDLSDISTEFRALPIAEAMTASFQIGHFKLQNFYGPGQLFHGFEEQVMEPWRQALAAAGFTWTRCYPIIFISGANTITNYHLDYSHVLAWQRHGTKRFCGLKDPDRWTTLEQRMHHRGIVKPDAITTADEFAYEMTPGTVLWNAMLTPHWVEASDGVAYSINLSHGGVRLHGRLSPHEQEMEDWRRAHPEDAEVGVI
jgi:hypothetical protein